MSIFDSFIKVIFKNPKFGGAFGAFIAAVIAAFLNMGGISALLFVTGIGLTVYEIYAQSKR